MEAEVIKTFQFEAAHSLPNVPAGHKCRNIHGHSYRVDVHVTGPVDQRSGWVIDFGEVVRVVAPIIAELDHRLLNDVQGLANSTAENIGRYLFERISPALPNLAAMTVWESETSRAVYRGK